jgi:hypothetical protein
MSYESITVISLIFFAFFNIIRLNKLNKKALSYLIAIIIPIFFGAWQRGFPLREEDIYLYAVVYLPISLSATYILNRKFYFPFRVVLAYIIGFVIFTAGLFLGLEIGIL